MENLIRSIIKGAAGGADLVANSKEAVLEKQKNQGIMFSVLH